MGAPWTPREACCIHTHSGITVTPRIILGQDPMVTPAGNKSEPFPRNTLGTQLKPAQPPRCSQFGGRLLSQLLLRIRELEKFCWRPFLLPSTAEHLVRASQRRVRQLPLFWQPAHPHRPHTGRWIPPLLCQLLGAGASSKGEAF